MREVVVGIGRFFIVRQCHGTNSVWDAIRPQKGVEMPVLATAKFLRMRVIIELGVRQMIVNIAPGGG